nr:zinc finger and SCAN domain-containing protein 4-like [Manis javanica]
MDLVLTTSFLCKPSKDEPILENTDFKPSHGPILQKAEISVFQNPQHSLFQNGSKSCARQELQRLYNSFRLWLQPEKHSKDEIIFQVVLEQFMVNRHYSDRSTLKEKWESSGRKLERFIEDLSDDWVKPPRLVHVHMQGQEALFSENMPLREVILHLSKQLFTGTPREHNMGTPSWPPQEASLETGPGDEDKENGGNISLKICQVNGSIASQGNETPSLLMIQGERGPRPEEQAVSLKNPLSSARAGPGTSRAQEWALTGPSSQDVLMEAGPGFLPRPDQASPEPVPNNQGIEGNSTRGGQQEKFHRAPKSYRCEECPRMFRCLSQLKAHQRRHSNERTFICAKCGKGFFQTSDLRQHQRIHAGEKPFVCSTCERSFNHKTNLQAHERIHTGEKPYTCPLCRKSYRQSSTYHRHLRAHQKTAFRGVSSTPEASSATGPM